ncbi:pyridoxal-phosphate dependent enzyme [Salinimonas sp. HHU 13199]|uniref:Pyridoxal-phosphate dependent enzyme n=1 Tax=Salinimonas profundi TaxID=2729140 RepID=A0ABR8LPY2_9ALTE|nr:pyridoxal-phosphate dependent enzyme [Salinimonas profundi]MBD3586159.1 pyridoxal-phosphate dependent enzyme [Salinimonas profundi]
MPQSITDLLSLTMPSPLHIFRPDWPGAEGLNIYIKRDDLIHSVISGNKWRKLSSLFNDSQSLPSHIVSFGGGYSNHLHALGYLCKTLNINCTVIVRGDYSKNMTPMLIDLKHWQINIRFVDRATYSKRHDKRFLTQLRHQYDDALIIPEGGSSSAALTGVSALVDEISVDFDYILAPVASGATLAGIASSVSSQKTVCGIAVLKGNQYLESLVSELMPGPQGNWYVDHRFHGGGYAKQDVILKDFCHEMQETYNIPVEPVYSGKLFFALKNKIAAGEFAEGSSLIALHTGGLQGARN